MLSDGVIPEFLDKKLACLILQRCHRCYIHTHIPTLGYIDHMSAYKRLVIQRTETIQCAGTNLKLSLGFPTLK